MRIRIRWFVAVAAFAAVALPGVLWATDPAVTTITVEKMHCPTCAKKIVRNLAEVPGVAAAQTNLPTKTVAITPQTGQTLSPRTLWDVVEKSGHKPVRLEGPSGTFTEQPQS